MNAPVIEPSTKEVAWKIQIHGLVQGVGFRPAVWTLAQRHQLRGHVLNNGHGVQIMAAGRKADLVNFIKELTNNPPTLAKIGKIDWETISPEDISQHELQIVDSEHTGKETGIVPDAATCSECLKEIFDPFARRFRYPFTNCTHCGPRLTIQQHIPYDRPYTTMHSFSMCDECAREYGEPHDRRFHAEPIACYVCGPKVWLARADHKPIAIDSFSMMDDVDAVCTLLKRGYIVAIKLLSCKFTHFQTMARKVRLN